jgi:hypothetical protein
VTPVGEAREAYARFATADPRPSRFANDGRDYRAWAERADRSTARAQIVVPGMEAKTFYTVEPTPQSAERAYGDTLAREALRGTLTGESMADWGPRYIREARALLRMRQQPGTLWERVSA